MNRNQKITLIIMLLIMAAILIYPPTETDYGAYTHGAGRELIFSIGGFNRINIGSLVVQLSIVILIGGGFIIIFGLKNRG